MNPKLLKAVDALKKKDSGLAQKMLSLLQSPTKATMETKFSSDLLMTIDAIMHQVAQTSLS